MPEYWSGAGTAAVQGGLGIIGSLVTGAINKRLAAQQNQYNIDMWKMQAEYNSPQSQMERFRQAGLNPNLIYGQGSNGNMSQAPQMVTPQAPELSKEMMELGKAFNIENLRTLIAHRKEAEANASNADTNAQRNRLIFHAEQNFGNNWTYDYSKGIYVKRPTPTDFELYVNPSAYYFNRILENNYNRSALIPYRAALLEQQKNYLVPQVHMANYESLHYPTSYWIGQGSKIAQGVGNIVGMFHPKNWIIPLGKRGGAYRAPNGKIYYY